MNLTLANIQSCNVMWLYKSAARFYSHRFIAFCFPCQTFMKVQEAQFTFLPTERYHIKINEIYNFKIFQQIHLKTALRLPELTIRTQFKEHFLSKMLLVGDVFLFKQNLALRARGSHQSSISYKTIHICSTCNFKQGGFKKKK